MRSSTLSKEIFDLVKNDKLNELTDLLQHNKSGSSVLNYVNQRKETPLHIAASKFNYDFMQLLLEYGSHPNLQNEQGQTPLLYILLKLKDCQCDNCTRRTVKCINLLGEFNANMNIPDVHEETPLHLAAEMQSVECASALLDNGATVTTYKDKPMLTILLEKVPSIILSVLDRSVEVVGTKGIHEPECEVTFNLGVILPTRVMTTHLKMSPSGNQLHPLSEHGQNDNSATNAADVYSPHEEMKFLNTLLDNSDQDSKTYKAILHHPLVNVFTDIKWKRLELLFYAFLLLQMAVLAAYTGFIFLTIFKDCPYDIELKTLKLKEAYIRTQQAAEMPALDIQYSQPICEIKIVTKVLSIFVLFVTVIVFIKEFQHAIMDFREYFKDILNYIQLVGLGAISATIVIAWDSESTLYSWLFYPVAAFSIGISWCQVFIQIGRVPQLAIYVDMYAKISINFCWSLCIYSLILIGFAMSYCVLFPASPHLVDIPLALIKVMTMMVGELDYEGLFPESTHNGTNSEEGPFRHPVSAHLWYVTFVIMVTLVLMNLLVGLAVSDIHGCRKNAEIVVIKRRIRYIAYLENTFYLATHFTPRVIKDFLRKRIAIVMPPGESIYFWKKVGNLSDISCIRVRPNDSSDNLLSNESKKSIKYWIMNKYQNKWNRKCVYKKPTDANERSSSSEYQKMPSRTSWTEGDTPVVGNSINLELSITRLERKFSELDSKLDAFFRKISEHQPMSD